MFNLLTSSGDDNFLRENYIKAFTKAGSPEGLEHSLIFSDPVTYDRNVYQHLENFYKNDLQKISFELKRCLDSDLSFIQDSFTRYIRHNTTIKQLVPFLIFADFFNVDQSLKIETAAALVICQYFPSTTIDDILDESRDTQTIGNDKVLVSICSILYGLKKMSTSTSTKVLGKIISNSLMMYELMREEQFAKFSIPDKVLKTDIENYVRGRNRLISTVFFSIGFELAAELSKIDIPPSVIEGISDLRRVRQINDEIADSLDDFESG